MPDLQGLQCVYDVHTDVQYENDYKIMALMWHAPNNGLFYVAGVPTHVPY